MEQNRTKPKQSPAPGARSEPTSISPTSLTFNQRHYTVAEIAALWNLSGDAIRRIFRNEPGVLVITNQNARSKRRYTTLRIPESVLERVHRQMSLFK